MLSDFGGNLRRINSFHDAQEALKSDGPLLLSSFPVPRNFRGLDKLVFNVQDVKGHELRGLHAMAVVGWDFDPADGSARMLLRNSWGELSGKVPISVEQLALGLRLSGGAIYSIVWDGRKLDKFFTKTNTRSGRGSGRGRGRGQGTGKDGVVA